MEYRYSLGKEITFEAAHRLVKGYNGKCNNLHGHSWVVLVKIGCNKLNAHGMAVDFSVLGAMLKRLHSILDHTTFLYEKDTELNEALSKINTAVVLFDDNPTSEVLAEFILRFAQKDDALSKALELAEGAITSVLVYETCTSSCELSPDAPSNQKVIK